MSANTQTPAARASWGLATPDAPESPGLNTPPSKEPNVDSLKPLDRIARYVRMRNEKPLSRADDIIHGIHMGTEWEAELRLTDLHAQAAELARLTSEVEELKGQLFKADEYWQSASAEAEALTADNADKDQRIAELEGGVHVDLPTAVVVERAFLPTNPNKMRSAAPEVVQAANRFKDLVRATLNATPKEGE